MALPSIFPGGIVAEVHDLPQRSLVKVVALLRELAVGGVTGSTGVTRANSTALETNRVVKASAGTLVSLIAYNTNAATRYLQIFDAASLPADGTVPLMTLPISANSTGSYSFEPQGLPFTTGLVAALSSTDDTLTIAAAADGLFLATYY